MSDNTQRLEALYEQLADTRATWDGVWGTRTDPNAAEDEGEFATAMSYLDSLEREEADLLDEIESLGGEDPDA